MGKCRYGNQSRRGTDAVSYTHLDVYKRQRASWFSHKAEIAKPYYYKVYLAEHDVVTEMVPTERAVMFRFTCLLYTSRCV